jgi:tetratricopeptide (TPR) repeat protein
VKKFELDNVAVIFKQNPLLSFSPLILITIISLALLSCGQKTPEDPIKHAYELRMSGKADEAKVVLDEAIAIDSTYAAAHYELSRTLFHMGFGKEQETADYLNKSKEANNLAIKYDPDNVIYNYFACRIAYLEAYVALSGDEDTARAKLDELRELYKKVLELEPEYHEVSLYLAEIYGVLPKQFGLNYTIAENYGMTLDSKDKIWGAKALTLLRSKAIDVEDLWNKILADYPDDPDALEELGKYYLREGRTEEGLRYLNDAITADSTKSFLFLDIARFHTINAMLDKTKLEKNTKLTEEVINKYLETNPIPPLKAFAIGFLGNLKSKTNEEEGKKLLEQASTLDPYYSKLGDIPSMDLFVPPDEVSHNHRYLFRPM